MEKSIKGIKKIAGRYILEKTKEEKEKNAEIIKKEEMQEIKEEITLEEAQKQIKADVGCFKLVVIKKVPWYKKAIRTIGSLFERLIKVVT